MKRILSVLVVLCLLTGAFSVNAFAADSSEEANANLTREYTEIFLSQINRGDLDGDNKVTVEEASKYLRIAAKLDEPEAGVNYDLTGDGKITTADARKALRIASGLEFGATDEEIFEYFKNELNTVKKTFPGFDRTTTSVATDSRITVSGVPKIPVSIVKWVDINANNEEIVSYYKRTADAWKKVASDEEYEAMLKDAESLYEPVEKTKRIESGSKSHYTYFPVTGLANTCRLEFEDIKDISMKTTDGKFIITLIMGSYTYDESNPYPATTYESNERQSLPYGKIFNLPEFNDDSTYALEEIVFDDGKVVLEVDSETGEIITADFFYSYKLTLNLSSEEEGMEDVVMKTTTTSEYGEKFNMLRAE